MERMDKFDIFVRKVKTLVSMVEKTDFSAVVSIEFLGGLCSDLHYIEEELHRLTSLES